MVVAVFFSAPVVLSGCVMSGDRFVDEFLTKIEAGRVLASGAGGSLRTFQIE